MYNSINMDKEQDDKSTRGIKLVRYKQKSKPDKITNETHKLEDIGYFKVSAKSNNDEFNKKRESIIAAIINKEIPQEFYTKSQDWKNLKTEITSFIKKICVKPNIKSINTIICKIKAGRGNNHDLDITINNRNFKGEFKFNCTCVSETPQFSSPARPSQYLSENFEEDFYDNHLDELVSHTLLPKPSREVYLKQIHSNIVPCMQDFKNLYDTDKKFNKMCKKISDKEKKKFIEKSTIKMKELSDYLETSQSEKIYMCYKNGKFHYDELNKDLYKLTELDKRENTNFIYKTKSGMKLEIKLRFKNGCGLQFPALQIKRKIPYVRELKTLCETHNIELKGKVLKKDILKKLDENNIIY